MIKCLKIAHRGVHKNSPENSISSFEDALKIGADVIELDVRLCASGEVVVFHDPWFKRMLGVSGSIKKTVFSDISKLRYIDSDESIPLLDDVLDQFADRISINIEIKDINISNHDVAKKVISLLKKINFPESIWVSSFNPLVLDFIKTVEPRVKTGFLFNKTKYIPLLLSQFLHFDAWHPNYELIDEEFVKVARRKNKKIYAWTVNNSEEIGRLKNLGIDGIITDYIELI